MTRFLSTTWWNFILEVAHVVLRVLAHGFAATSVVTILTSNQEIYMLDRIPIAKAHYNYSSALRYKLVIDALVSVFSLLSSILVYKKSRSSHTEPRSSFYFNLLIHDVVMMTLVISGCAAATGVGFVALKGIEKPGISWAPICHLARKFCFMGTLSIAFSYAAFASIIILTFISAWKLKLLATH
ncbi:CASP-like protein 1F2 [Bidens hawaiensis]|uniref:CASP-like protein 1F2 n=1 Tax=Bidens hawaiensis TaxID=980011 RepID=UPI00404B77F3